MGMTLIRAIYGDKCRVCGVKVKKGEKVWYRGSAGVLCVECGYNHNSKAGRMRERVDILRRHGVI